MKTPRHTSTFARLWWMILTFVFLFSSSSVTVITALGNAQGEISTQNIPGLYLKLPFDPGQDWRISNGWSGHANGLNPSFNLWAMDFVPNTTTPSCLGKAVLAAATGVIETLDPNWGQIIIRHSVGNFRTNYLHLNSFSPELSIGSVVSQGQQIGTCGNKGISFGAHIHFQVINGNPSQPNTGYQTTVQGYDNLETGTLGLYSTNVTNASSWDFRNGAGGWTIGNSLSNQTQEPLGLWFNVAGNDSQLISPVISVPAANYSRISVKMASTADKCRQLYFKREGDLDFSEDRAFYTEVIADGSTTTFYFDVSTNPNWQGTITQLRFDPACEALNGHAIRIDQIAFVTNALSWDFRNGAGGWTIGNSLSNQTQEPLGLWFNVAGNDSQLISPFISVPAANYSRIAITMASTTDTCRQLYFKREGDVSFAEDRAFYTEVIADGSTTTFYLDVSANPNWQGTITQLRFDPACEAVNGHAIRIDQIVFTVTPTPVTPTPVTPTPVTPTPVTPTPVTPTPVPNYSVWLPTVQR